MELIRPFSGLGKHDAPLAGGKGASLGEMTQAGIPVPPGFVVLAPTFDRFLTETDLVQEIDTILHSVKHDDVASVEHASEKIQGLILAAKMPTDIETAILDEHAKLGAEFVAVRSSATAEDGAEHAWAGQLDTHLNTPREEVVRNVQRCWSSLFTPRAIFYRFEKGLHGTSISVAVVVQKMVQSELSGIAFSVHPVTEDRNQLIIEAGYGLGEAIVSGQVTPDSYVVEKNPRRIIDVNVSEQSKALYRKEGGGNEWRDLAAKGTEQVLSEARILELAELIIHIENHYGFPCDIEWAYEAGKFYITQSRPITTLSNAQETVPQEMRSPKVLSKFFERERPLMYMMVWYDSDHDGLAHFTQQKVCDTLGVIPPKGTPGSVWYPPNELAGLEAEALRIINASHELRETMLAHTRAQWQKLAPYLKDGREVGDIDEFERLYADTCLFWHAMCTVYFRLPDHAELDAEFREGLAAIREETQEYSNHMAGYMQRSFERLAPTYARFSHHIAPKEVRRFVEGPSPELVAELERRVREGAFILNGVVHPLSELDAVLAKHGLALETIDTNASEFTGAVGYRGSARGRVRVVMSVADIASVQEGEILVSVLTDPNYVPAMQKAAAFITDEGGVMSHAAIVAREMKKPCVIGTKVATQVLKDGDLVEVDAERGVVRRLDAGDNVRATLIRHIESAKWQKDWEGKFSLLNCISCEPYYQDCFDILGTRTDEILIFHRDGITTCLLSVLANARFAKELAETIARDKTVPETWAREAANEYAALLRFSDHETADVVREFPALTHCVRRYSVYMIAMKSVINVLKGADQEHHVQTIVAARKQTERFFFVVEAILEKVAAHIARHTGYEPVLIESMLVSELLAYLSGSPLPPKDLLAARRRGCAFHFGSGMTVFDGDEAEALKKALFSKDTSVLRGVCAYPGSISGRAVIITDYVCESDKLKPGDVLVTGMTDPNFLPIMAKAAAILVDTGGLLSHAAISARELKVPCVIGLECATTVLKDGDLVEVDAEKGVVRVVERATV